MLQPPKIMLVTEAVKAGFLKPGMRIRTNGYLRNVDNNYFTGIVLLVDNTGIRVSRNDRKAGHPSWLINNNNTKATIEILEDDRLSGSDASTYNEECIMVNKQNTDKKENKDMTTGKDVVNNIDLLEKQFEEEKLKDVKIIVKHCNEDLQGILLKMLLKDKVKDIQAYARDLEEKEIAAAAAKAKA